MKSLRVTVVALILVSMTAFAAPNEGTWTGWVMDQKCAKEGKAAKEDCARRCIEGGSPMVLVTDKDKSLLTIANPKALNEHIGHHVRVQGSLSNDKLTVSKAEMLPDAAGK